MKIKKLIGARLLVKRVDVQTELPSGIVLPDEVAEKERGREGVVVMVGDGMWSDDGTKIPMTVKEGDRVLYREFAGYEFEDEGETYVIINEGDILAILS